jgi:hypothetical protein
MWATVFQSHGVRASGKAGARRGQCGQPQTDCPHCPHFSGVGVVRGFVVNVGKWAMGFQLLYPLCRIGDTMRADVAGVAR